MSDELPIILKSYALYKPIDAINETLSKRRRYSLGTSTEQTLLELLTPAHWGKARTGQPQVALSATCPERTRTTAL